MTRSNSPNVEINRNLNPVWSEKFLKQVIKHSLAYGQSFPLTEIEAERQRIKGGIPSPRGDNIKHCWEITVISEIAGENAITEPEQGFIDNELTIAVFDEFALQKVGSTAYTQFSS